MKSDSDTTVHRRLNPLTNEWTLVSFHRGKRPWNGQIEKVQHDTLPSYDPNCFLCPGNRRVSKKINPHYSTTFVFTNDYQAILPRQKGKKPAQFSDIFQRQDVSGTCRVICFSPKHNTSLGEMNTQDIQRVITLWKEQLTDLGKHYIYPQIFENKGTIMGCSNPHPHGQIWAGNFLPTFIEKEDTNQREYFTKHQSVLLYDYLQTELTNKTRVVVENEDWVVLVPYWAVWPFETMLLPKTHIEGLTLIDNERQQTLSEALKSILVRYDNLFETSFPYSMGLHGKPMDNNDYAHWQFHIHFYPPLLRSASVKKFLVGYEMLAEPQRDLTPEQAAAMLKDLPTLHYKHK